ncbi:unnamed protein product [Closterium sp. NIES-54]
MTPRVRQAAEAALGGVQAPAPLTSAVAAAGGRGSHDCAAAAGADHHRSHSSEQRRDQLRHRLCRLRHLLRATPPDVRWVATKPADCLSTAVVKGLR